AELPRGQRHALRVVPGARGDDAAGLLLGGESRQSDEGPAQLEGAGALEVLALEDHPGPGDLAQRAARLDRGPGGHAVEEARGPLERGEVQRRGHDAPGPDGRPAAVLPDPPASSAWSSSSSPLTEAASVASSPSGSPLDFVKESSIDRKRVP